MTLRDTLQSGLGPVTAALVDDIGVLCDLRRRDIPERQPDGSESTQWYKPIPAVLGVSVYLYQQSEDARVRLWGRELTVSASAITKRGSVMETDRLRPRDGEYAGRVFDVVKRLPDDIGGIAQLALVECVLVGDDTGGF